MALSSKQLAHNGIMRVQVSPSVPIFDVDRTLIGVYDLNITVGAL